MGRGRDFRGPRRRGFNDDDFSPPDMPDFSSRRSFSSSFSTPTPMAEGPEVDAVVKWFDERKGFGFVELGDGSGDAFLHVAVLQAAGRQSVLPGAKMRIAAAQGPKGRQVARVIEVDESAAAEAPRRDRPPRSDGGGFGRGPRDQTRDLSSAVEMTGTVKWFNGEKGFGFIAPEGGGKDVFVHISVLGRSGLTGLAEGQPVSMKVVETPKGREAVSIAPVG